MKRLLGIVPFLVLCVSLIAICIQEEPNTATGTEIVDEDKEEEKLEALDSKEVETLSVECISQEKYAYRSLDEKGRLLYDEMLSAILSHQDSIRLSSTDAELMRQAYQAICADYGGLFWMDGYAFTRYTQGNELVGLEFAPKYTMTEEERKNVQQQIDEVVEAWLGGISINDTEYDKVKYVYEVLISNTAYVENAADSQNIISVFLNGQTVCQGYACAVQYLLGQLGIQSAIVSGTALGEPHAWNLIRLDGAYYYMDATWGNAEYAGNDGEVKNFIDYNYMAMTTEEMQIGHVPDEQLVLPECTAVMANYFIKEGIYVEEWNPDQLGGLLSKAWEEKRMLTLRFSDVTLRQQTFQYFIDEGNIADYCNGITEINYIQDDIWNEISFCF